MQVSIQLDVDGNYQKCCVGAFELSMEKVNRFSCYKTSILQEKKKAFMQQLLLDLAKHFHIFHLTPSWSSMC